jgi:hypothetical protein
MADVNTTFGWLSSVDDPLVNPSYEYFRKNRWIMDFAGLPAGINGADKKQALRLNCKTAGRPERSFAETKVERINGTINLAGKPEFGDLTVIFYDNLGGGIVKDEDPVSGGEGSGSAFCVSDIIEQWSELIYQPNKGDAFGSASNYKAFAKLHLLRPQTLTPNDGGVDDFTALEANNSIEQTWVYQGLYPKNIKYGELDYSSSDVIEVNVTFKYDRAFRIKSGQISA